MQCEETGALKWLTRDMAEELELDELSQLAGARIASWTSGVMVREAADRGLKLHARKVGPGVVISDGQRWFFWSGGRTNLNHRLARVLARNKSATTAILLGAGIPATRNALFKKDEVEAAWSWAQSFGSAVVKPLDGRQGRDVIVDLKTKDAFAEAFAAVAAANGGRALVEEYQPGVEHRCLVVDGKMVAATRRRPASVVGDGVSRVLDLVNVHNGSNAKSRIQIPIAVDDELVSCLEDEGMTLGSVPKEGQRVFLRRTSNLHRGGDAIDATDEMTAEEIAVAESVARAIPGLRVFGVDLLVNRDGSDRPATVLEVNASPMISMHHFPMEGAQRDVAGAILDAAFPKTVRER